MPTAPTALIVVESCFGNTRAIAEAIAAGLTDAGTQARVLDAVQAPASLPANPDRPRARPGTTLSRPRAVPQFPPD